MGSGALPLGDDCRHDIKIVEDDHAPQRLSFRSTTTSGCWSPAMPNPAADPRGGDESHEIWRLWVKRTPPAGMGEQRYSSR